MSRAQANLLLMAAAALWGFGNVAQKTVLEHLERISVLALLGAALIFAVIVHLEFGRVAS